MGHYFDLPPMNLAGLTQDQIAEMFAAREAAFLHEKPGEPVYYSPGFQEAPTTLGGGNGPKPGGGYYEDSTRPFQGLLTDTATDDSSTLADAMLPSNVQNPWEWDPFTGKFGLTPTASALEYQPELTTPTEQLQQAMRQTLPSWGYRPRVRSYIEGLEQPLLGQYYGAMGKSGEDPRNYGHFQDWLLQRPGRHAAEGSLLPSRNTYIGGLGAFARPTGLAGTDWADIGQTARLLASQQGEGTLPDTPWAKILADNPDAASALARLATFNPRARSPMGQMRQRGINRAMDAYGNVPGSERGPLDWLGYLLGGGEEGTPRAPSWMTSRMTLPQSQVV